MPRRRPTLRSFSSPSGRFVKWVDVVRQARRRPGEWGLAMANVPASRVRAVRERRHPDLQHIRGGHLEAQARNTYTDDDGRRMADVFVRFVPEGETP